MGSLRRSCDFLFGACTAIACTLLVASAPWVSAQGKPLAVWVVGKGEKNGHPIVIRWRDAMPDPSMRAAYPWCVEVSWQLRRDENGKVPSEEAERTWDFETTLKQQIEESGVATEIASITYDEKRVWLYYGADRDTLVASLDAMKHDDPGLPVSYEIHADREWQALQELLGTVKE